MVDAGGVPVRLIAVAGECFECASARQTGHVVIVQGGAAVQVVDVSEGLARFDAMPGFLAEALDLPQPKPQRGRRFAGLVIDPVRGCRRQAVVPAACLHVRRQTFDAVRHGILNQLRRAVEAHRQAVENAAVERRWPVAFQPRGDVGQEGEAGGVGFREAVFAESLDLIENPLGELAIVAARQHAVDELLLEWFQTAAPLPRRHGAAQLVGFAGAESRRHHRQLDHLLLKDRDAQRAFQHLAHGVVGIAHRLQSAAAAQVWMHHVALDRPRPHDRDFDDQVVEVRRLEARQHGHLRPRFHLENAHAVGALQHGVGCRIVLGNVGHAQRAAEQGKGLANGGEHAEAQHIDLQQPQRFEIVLVPLNDGALRHRGVLHRHQLRQGAGGDDEAAHVLREMPRESLYFAHQPGELLDDVAGRIGAGGLESPHHVFASVPPGDGFG